MYWDKILIWKSKWCKNRFLNLNYTIVAVATILYDKKQNVWCVWNCEMRIYLNVSVPNNKLNELLIHDTHRQYLQTQTSPVVRTLKLYVAMEHIVYTACDIRLVHENVEKCVFFDWKLCTVNNNNNNDNMYMFINYTTSNVI